MGDGIRDMFEPLTPTPLSPTPLHSIPLNGEDEIDHFPNGPLPSLFFCDPIDFLFDGIDRAGDRNRKADPPKQTKIDEIVPDESDRFILQAMFCFDHFVCALFVPASLMHILDAELFGPPGDHDRRTARNDPDPNPRSLQEPDAVAVINRKPFDLPSVLVKVEGSVGHHPIDIEKEIADSHRLPPSLRKGYRPALHLDDPFFEKIMKMKEAVDMPVRPGHHEGGDRV